MLNHTSFQDPVLESFLEKAKEMEQHAGSPAENKIKEK
jgi:hypothetical protein